MDYSSIAEKFWSHVDRTGQDDDCWIWNGGKSGGYGMMFVGKSLSKYKNAAEHSHRISWKIANNLPIPEGTFVCHRCGNRACVNPRHLYLGTQFENMRDRVSHGKDPNKTKTHCPSGHEYNEGNTYVRPGGHRACRECRKAYMGKYYLNKKSL